MSEIDPLRTINVGMAFSHLVLVLSIGALISRRLFTRTPDSMLADIGNGRVHARAAMFVILLYALLGLDTAIGGYINAHYHDQIVARDVITIAAVCLRVMITLVLLGWLAYTAEPRIRERWPAAGRHIDRILHWR